MIAEWCRSSALSSSKAVKATIEIQVKRLGFILWSSREKKQGWTIEYCALGKQGLRMVVCPVVQIKSPEDIHAYL